MNIVNLTPHRLNIYKDLRTETDIQNGVSDAVAWLEVPASGQVVRVVENREQLPVINGIPVSRATYGATENLPDPQPDTIYIVSTLVLQQCAGRTDVFSPGPAIRDSEGRIIGCDGLSAGPASSQISLAYQAGMRRGYADCGSPYYSSKFTDAELTAFENA